MVIIEIVVIAALISINFFFALSEVAFISSKKAHIIEARRQGNKRAKIILDFMKKPEKFLSSVQVGITLVGIVSGAFGGLTMAGHLGDMLAKIPAIAPVATQLSVVLTVGLITYFSIVIGELFPKTLALRNPEKIALAVIPVMNLFTKIFYPIVLFLSFSTRQLLRLFGVRGVSETRENPIKEIVALTRFAVLNKKINTDQEKIVYNAININKIMLHEIMIKKQDVDFLTSDMSLADAMIEAHVHHHTRYPLVDKNTNGLAGYINVKDIFDALQINPQSASLQSIAREILYFRENDKVIEVLPQLMKQSQHIAMVKNTEGEIIGLVTLEVLIESIIGDINDEFDSLSVHIYKIAENRLIIGGGVRLKRLKRELELDLPGTDELLSDWLMKKSPEGVKPGKRIACGKYEFIVRKMKKGKINELILQK
jgi:putative hemolysin